ncbi:uncharacterized protein LOC144048560 [Vanacampus margaritifer]
MLKDLVRERLIAAADEIFGLFEKTIASYEEQLRRAREENERQRQQLEAVSMSQMMLSGEDVQPLTACQEEPSFQAQSETSTLDWDHVRIPHVKEELEAFDISKLPSLPATDVSVESEDDEAEPPEWSRFHPLGRNADHHEGPPPDDLFAPLSFSDDDMEEEASGAATPTRRLRNIRVYRAKARFSTCMASRRSPVAETAAASPTTEAPGEKTGTSLDYETDHERKRRSSAGASPATEAPSEKTHRSFYCETEQERKRRSSAGASPATEAPSEKTHRSLYCETEQERKRRSSAVWEHFDVVSSMRVKCRICSTELSYFNKSTSSMLRHFRARHEHEEITNTLRVTTANRKHALDQAVLNFIIKESQPLSIVESDSFRELLRALEPSYVLPSRKTVKELGPKNIKNEQE